MTDEFGQRLPGPAPARNPSLSIIAVVYNMPREAPRTLFSLSSSYQRHIGADDYEVIVVDNGSRPALDPGVVAALTGNFRLIRIDPAPPSPARALNRGLAEAKGDIIGVMIDGARLVTPGFLHFARCGAQLHDNALVASLGWYLGHDFQRVAAECGYDQAREDELLATIGWPKDGYRLFEIATLDESSLDGWFCPTQESNAFFMRRHLWAALGGFDERFDAPGGGLLNLDTFCRALELPGIRLVRLLGEGTFHQLHGGIATNAPVERLHEDLPRWAQQYAALRGHPFSIPVSNTETTYIGTLPRPALVQFLRSALDPVWPVIWPGMAGVEPPLGRYFDPILWSCGPIAKPADPTIAAVLDLAHEEFRAGRYDAVASIARLIYRRHPSEPESRRLLSLVCGWLHEGETPAMRSRAYHRALATANHLLGDAEVAAFHRQRARTSPVWEGSKRASLFAAKLLSGVVYPLDSQRRAAARAKWEGTLRQIALKLRRSGWLKRLKRPNENERQNTSIAKQ